MPDFRARTGSPGRLAFGLACLLFLVPPEPTQAERLRLSFNRRKVNGDLQQTASAVGLPTTEDGAGFTEEASAVTAEDKLQSGVVNDSAAKVEIPSNDPFKNISLLEALELNQPGADPTTSSTNALAIASVLSDHFHNAAKADCARPTEQGILLHMAGPHCFRIITQS